MTIIIFATIIVGIFVFAFIPEDSVAKKMAYTVLIVYVGGAVVGFIFLGGDAGILPLLWPLSVLMN